MDTNDYILQNFAGNVYCKDKEGKYLICNEALAKFLNLKSAQDIIGKTDEEILSSAELAKAIRDADKKVIETGQEMTIEEVGISADNELAFFLTKKSPLRDEENNVVGLIGTSMDITNYVDIREHIIKNTAGNLYWKDRQGRYLGCNETFAKMIGLNSPKEIVGKTDRDLFLSVLGEERIKALVDADQLVMSSNAEKTIEETGVNEKNELAIYITKKVPLLDRHKNVIGLIGTSIDITKQKQAEITKSEFMRNMSHDIMTPLTGIVGVARLLYDDEGDANKKHALGLILQSGDNLVRLLKQILEVSEVGNKVIKITEFNLYDLIAEIIEMMGAAANFKGLALTFTCPKEAVVNSDRIRLSRILVNLISNAIKFTDKGFVHINVVLGEYLKIMVQDTGIGIPEEKRDIIFDKFQKLSESGKQQKFMGAGVGLYLVKEFCNDINFEIKVESEVGKGTKFILTKKML